MLVVSRYLKLAGYSDELAMIRKKERMMKYKKSNRKNNYIYSQKNNRRAIIDDDGNGTCIAAAPSKPHVRKTSFEAATHDFPLMKNSFQTVAGKTWFIEPGEISPSSFVQRTNVPNTGTSVKTYTTFP